MDQKFLPRTFRFSALTLAIVALSACGGGGSSSSGGRTPPPPATDDETTLAPGTALPEVDENNFPTLEGAISGYEPIKRAPVSNNATRDCNPTDFYIVSQRRLQVGFQRGLQLNDRALSENQRLRLAKIAGLALDTTLTNYGFSGSEAELQNSETLPYYICIVPRTKYNTRELLAEIGTLDGDERFYRQAKDQFANSFVERIRSSADNYSEVYFWFDEGLSNFAGDNKLIGSPVSWVEGIAPNGAIPEPMSVERISQAPGNPNDGTSSLYFSAYPYYATVIAYFLDSKGLSLENTDLAAWLDAGVEQNDFGKAFDVLGLGGKGPGAPISYSTLKTNHVTLIKDWLVERTATTQLTDFTAVQPALNPADVTEVIIERQPGWQFNPIIGYNRQPSGAASLSFDSLTYTLPDASYKLYLRTAAADVCYGNLEIQVTNQKAADIVSIANAQAIACKDIPL